MKIHTLGFNDFEEEKYTLIGIHTTLEDYKLAYLLNKHLNIQLAKTPKGLEFECHKKEDCFSLYNFSSKKYNLNWFLIANKFSREIKLKPNELLLATEEKIYLIAEKKKVDYFVKISGDIALDYIIKIVNTIKSIEQVITSYSMDQNTLKSKHILIF